MNALCWNARGLGNSQAFHELRRLLSAFSPSLVFLCETRLHEDEYDRWKNTFGYDEIEVVNADGRSGGLAMLWKNNIEVSVRSKSKGHIDCVVTWEERQWRFTGFYGNPEVRYRKFSWELLRRLEGEVRQDQIPWLIGGDFNEIIYDAEKNGGNARALSQMNAFRDTILDCRLHEVKGGSKELTWVKKQKGKREVWVRLDRFLVNRCWDREFTNTKTRALDLYGSDHRPILCSFERIGRKMEQGKRRFHFEEKWLSEPSFVPDFLHAWEEMNKIGDFSTKLTHCQRFLQNWAGNRFNNLAKQIESLRKQRVKLLGRPANKDNGCRLNELDKEINKLTEMEETHWRQRARANWLANGDRNTPAFHAYANARRKRNKISELYGVEGDRVTDSLEMAKVVEDYFRTLFTTSDPKEDRIEEVTRGIQNTLTNESCELLDDLFTAEEVRKAIFSLHPSKSPGTDGLSGRFYQRFWPEIGDDVTAAVLNVLNNGGSLEEWNKTLIVMIPKVQHPKRMQEFRPISLCNTIYKGVAKVLANRLKKALPEVIDEHQSAFVAGRQITDNIIVGYECMHSIRTSGRNSDIAALKLDMSKAYDRVEWQFVESMLKRMNFPRKFTNLIMKCISTVHYSFVMNGRIYGSIFPSRGLRQGDPLSPLLFVICAQGFSSILHNLVRTGDIVGVQFGRQGPTISHLFFADDSMVFFRADRRGCMALKSGFARYEVASGQCINYDKSAITFNSSIGVRTIRRVQNILGVTVVDKHEIYLGLPTVTCRKKRLQFGFIRDRALKKLASWNSKTLSAGGKEVLIKSVVQAIPTYAMQCFRIPSGLCHDIERACNNFWWGKTELSKGMSWMSWKRLCKPKAMGGMGFRDLTSFNKALLAKQIWRMMKNPSSLVAKVLCAKYFQKSSILEAKVGSNASYIWRSLAWARSIIVNGLLWRVGDGKSIRILYDQFVENLDSKVLRSMILNEPQTKLVTFISEDGSWDMELLEIVFGEYLASIIAEVEISGEGDDNFHWRWGPKKHYTVKYGYLAETGFFNPPTSMSSEPKSDWKKLVWHTDIPPKCKIFLWRLLREKLAMPANLNRHGMQVKEICGQCGRGGGNTNHAIYFCDLTKHLWKGTIYWFILTHSKFKSTLELGRAVRETFSSEEYDAWAVLSYLAWKLVCHVRHKGEGRCDVGYDQAVNYIEAYREARTALRPAAVMGICVGERIWRPPPFGRYRLDVDAAVDYNTMEFGVGAAICDWKGRVCAAMAVPMCQPPSVVEAEMIAAVFGIGLCLQEGLGPVELFSDSILAVRAMNGEDGAGEYFVDEYPILSQFSRDGLIIGFSHMYRSANRLAHDLARFGASCSEFVSWNNDFPPFVRSSMND